MIRFTEFNSNRCSVVSMSKAHIVTMPRRMISVGFYYFAETTANHLFKTLIESLLQTTARLSQKEGCGQTA